MLKVLCVSALFLATSSVCSAQAVREEPPMATIGGERAARQKETERLKGGQRTSREASINLLPLLFGRRISKQQKIRLAPAQSDLSRYAEFLQKPRTGLIKLFSDVGCEENTNVVRADDVCLQWIPNSGFYSFREKAYKSDFLADIRLKNGMLVSDGFLAQSILVNLGDVDLETVSSSSNGLKFLNEFQPAAESKAALTQVEQMIKGIRADNFIYRKSLPAIVNATYALRVTAYRGNFLKSYRGQLFNILAGDKRIDATIAFRILGKNDDGSLTLLWKELSRKDAPKVLFQKRKKD